MFADLADLPAVVLSELTAANAWPPGQLVSVSDQGYALYISNGSSWVQAASGSLPLLNPADLGASPSASAATNTAAIQSALTTARLAGGRTVVLDIPGTYLINLQTHPIDSSYRAGLIIGAKTHLRLGPGVIIKLADSATGVASQNSLLYNYNIAAGGDEQIVVEGGTWDGNSVNQTIVCSGLLLTRTRNCLFRNVVTKNCRGTASSGSNEKFHFSTSLSTDTHYVNCQAVGDSGSTASGFSANSATNLTWTDCTARGMSVANGFTHNTCRGLQHVNCRSYLNTLYGFNTEVSKDVTYNGCISGGESAAATTYPYASGTNLGNTGIGFVILDSVNVELNGCISRKNDQGANWSASASGSVSGGTYSDNVTFGMGISTPANVRVSAETTISGNGTAALAIPGPDLASAVGYVGSANPAVPATTVAQINPFPKEVTVFVTGGTVTVIAVGADSSGLTSGSFVVPVGQSITLTYSSAPTWKWFLN